MKIRSYPVCPHCGSWALIERGIVGEWCAEADEWRYGPGDDYEINCGDCDESFPLARMIALPIPSAEIDKLEREASNEMAAADSVRGTERHHIARRNAQALDAALRRALAHNAKAREDDNWLRRLGLFVRAA
jgi:hypothetical protein